MASPYGPYGNSQQQQEGAAPSWMQPQGGAPPGYGYGAGPSPVYSSQPPSSHQQPYGAPGYHGAPHPYEYSSAPPPGGYEYQQPPPFMTHPPRTQEMTATGGATDSNPLIDAHTAQLLSGLPGITIRQRVSIVEAITQGIWESKNEYTLHPGSGHEALEAPPIMSAMERSNGCSRCCCAPWHNVFVEFKHSQDPKAQGAPVAFTFERQGCCSKWVCCCNCMECCLDSMNLHAGAIQEDPDSAGDLSDYSRVIGSAKQPIQFCSCTPTLEVFNGARAPTDKDSRLSPFSLMHGPFIFGGCTELCCSSDFPISRPSSQRKIGDVAVIRKLRPRDCGDFFAEFCTDSDRYTIEFKDPSLTPQQKATLLGSLMLTDFMFFELDNGICRCSQKQLKITCCLCYCGGCLCPCSCTLDGSNSNNGPGE